MKSVAGQWSLKLFLVILILTINIYIVSLISNLLFHLLTNQLCFDTKFIHSVVNINYTFLFNIQQYVKDDVRLFNV